MGPTKNVVDGVRAKRMTPKKITSTQHGQYRAYEVILTRLLPTCRNTCENGSLECRNRSHFKQEHIKQRERGCSYDNELNFQICSRSSNLEKCQAVPSVKEGTCFKTTFEYACGDASSCSLLVMLLCIFSCFNTWSLSLPYAKLTHLKPLCSLSLVCSFACWILPPYSKQWSPKAFICFRIQVAFSSRIKRTCRVV